MHRGCFGWTPTPPPAVRRTPRPGPARVCVCFLFLAGSGRPAPRARSGAPQLFLVPLWLSALLARSVPCVFCFFFLVRARVVSRFLWFPAPGALGLGTGFAFFSSSRLSALRALSLFFCPAWPLATPWCLVLPPPPTSFVSGWFRRCHSVSPLFFFSACARVVSGFFRFPAPGALGLGAVFCLLCGPPASRLSVRSLLFLCHVWPLVAPWWLLPPPPPCRLVLRSFSFFSLCAPVNSGFLRFPAPGALSLGAVRCLLCWPPASRLSVRSRLFRASRLAVGCSPMVAAPPPLLCLAVFVASAQCCVPCVVLCCVSRVAVLRVVSPGVVLLCAVLFCCARLVPLLVVPCPLVLPVALGPCALRRSVLRCSPALCVFCRCVVVCAVVRRSALCCVCPWVLCCAFPVLLALCGTVLRCAGAVALCCSCGVCCCWRPVLWCAAVCCAVSFGVLWCTAGSGGPWLSAGAVLWRTAVRFALLVVLVCVFSLCVRCCVAMRVVLFGSGCVCAVVGATCCGVSLCVVVSPWVFCGVMVPLWCVVVSCCAVRCPVVSCALCCVLRCSAALRCCNGGLCCAVVCAAGVCFSFYGLFLC